MTAKIVLDGGVPTVGSIIVPAGTVVTYSNQNDVGVNGWGWTLKDKPLGSLAGLSTAVGANGTFTADIAGSYGLELITYTDAARTVFDGSDLQGVGVRYGAPHTWRLPFSGETNQFDQILGWKPEVNEILKDIRASLGGGGGNPGIKFHLRSGDNIVVVADYQYIVKSPAPIVDGGASLTISPGAQLVVIP